jgi:hypothetical protein
MIIAECEKYGARSANIPNMPLNPAALTFKRVFPCSVANKGLAGMVKATYFTYVNPPFRTNHH